VSSVYLTENGVAVQKIPVLITAPEWLMIWELSHITSTPVGTLIVNLARAESLRLKAAK
jgi:hypothetical protein